MVKWIGTRGAKLANPRAVARGKDRTPWTYLDGLGWLRCYACRALVNKTHALATCAPGCIGWEARSLTAARDELVRLLKHWLVEAGLSKLPVPMLITDTEDAIASALREGEPSSAEAGKVPKSESHSTPREPGGGK